LNIEELSLTEDVEKTPVFSINTSWKKQYYADITLRNVPSDNVQGLSF
jgi:hypothetical protein